jgi:hypothetical protein
MKAELPTLFIIDAVHYFPCNCIHVSVSSAKAKLPNDLLDIQSLQKKNPRYQSLKTIFNPNIQHKTAGKEIMQLSQFSIMIMRPTC